MLSKPDPGRRIGLCTLAFGAKSANAGAALPPVPPTVSTSPPSATATASAAVAGAISSTMSSSPRLTKSPEAECESVPAAVCPGYLSEADENASAVDFPPADLPVGTAELRIVITHVDDECHIYGHALREGTTPFCRLPTFLLLCTIVLLRAYSE